MGSLVGRVLIYRSKGLLPKLIRYFTKSKYNHVGVIVERTNYGYIVEEAQAQGIISTEYTFEYLKRRREDKEYPIHLLEYADIHSVSNVKAFSNEAKLLVGTPYDFFALVRIAWSIITGKKIYGSNKLKKMICSEFASVLVTTISDGKVDLSEEYDKEHDYITPDDFYNSKHFKLMLK